MEIERTCYLCGQPADVQPVQGGRNQRLSVACEADCPRYVITRLAIRELKRNPHRKPYVADRIRALSKGTADVPVIRTGKGSKALIVLRDSPGG